MAATSIKKHDSTINCSTDLSNQPAHDSSDGWNVKELVNLKLWLLLLKLLCLLLTHLLKISITHKRCFHEWREVRFFIGKYTLPRFVENFSKFSRLFRRISHGSFFMFSC